MLKYRRSNGGKRNEEKEILRSVSKPPQIENTLMNSITKHALCIATVSLLQLNANAVIDTGGLADASHEINVVRRANRSLGPRAR